MIMKCCSYTSCCWWTVSGCSISFWILFRSSLCRFSSGRRVRWLCICCNAKRKIRDFILPFKKRAFKQTKRINHEMPSYEQIHACQLQIKRLNTSFGCPWRAWIYYARFHYIFIAHYQFFYFFILFFYFIYIFFIRHFYCKS